VITIRKGKRFVVDQQPEGNARTSKDKRGGKSAKSGMPARRKRNQISPDLRRRSSKGERSEIHKEYREETPKKSRKKGPLNLFSRPNHRKSRLLGKTLSKLSFHAILVRAKRTEHNMRWKDRENVDITSCPDCKSPRGTTKMGKGEMKTEDPRY